MAKGERARSNLMTYRRFNEALSYFAGKIKNPPKGYTSDTAPLHGDIAVLQVEHAVGCVGMCGGENNLTPTMQATIDAQMMKSAEFRKFWNEVRDVCAPLGYKMKNRQASKSEVDWVIVDKDHLAAFMGVEKSAIIDGYVKPSPFTPAASAKKTPVAKSTVKGRAQANATAESKDDDGDELPLIQAPKKNRATKSTVKGRAQADEILKIEDDSDATLASFEAPKKRADKPTVKGDSKANGVVETIEDRRERKAKRRADFEALVGIEAEDIEPLDLATCVKFGSQPTANGGVETVKPATKDGADTEMALRDGPEAEATVKPATEDGADTEMAPNDGPEAEATVKPATEDGAETKKLSAKDIIDFEITRLDGPEAEVAVKPATEDGADIEMALRNGPEAKATVKPSGKNGADTEATMLDGEKTKTAVKRSSKKRRHYDWMPQVEHKKPRGHDFGTDGACD